jgi:hypothetical protein
MYRSNYEASLHNTARTGLFATMEPNCRVESIPIVDMSPVMPHLHIPPMNVEWPAAHVETFPFVFVKVAKGPGMAVLATLDMAG